MHWYPFKARDYLIVLAAAFAGFACIQAQHIWLPPILRFVFAPVWISLGTWGCFLILKPEDHRRFQWSLRACWEEFSSRWPSSCTGP